jgi:hypothetical protein
MLFQLPIFYKPYFRCFFLFSNSENFNVNSYIFSITRTCIFKNLVCVIYIINAKNINNLLLIDNAGGHNIILELKNKLTNVEVFYLPANAMSVLQPLD